MATITPGKKRASRPSSTGRRAAPRVRREPDAPEPAAPRSRGSRARNLVVVESPTKARTVKNILGDDYEVIASVGHVRDLPPYGYGVESVENLNFTPKYVVVKDKRRGVDKSDVVADIAKAAKNATRVFLSTDPDREGEAIAWHIKEAAGIPDEKVTRVVFHEITKPAIEAAFAEATGAVVDANSDHHRKAPGKIDMDLVDAQQARRVLDRLIGFPLTWFVQKKVSRGASAGRVQSVALGLIVKREKEIQNFRAVEYWSIHADLAKADRGFEAELSNFPAMTRDASMKPPFRAGGPAIPNETSATALLETYRRSDFVVATVNKGERRRGPVPPFTTSTFQQAAVNRLGMSAARAMGIAQELYEGVSGQAGLITYMRTDSVSISPIARGQARDWATSTWGKDFVPEKERVYATRSKGAQEAHEAIRPTEPAASPESLRRALSADQFRVYQLIWQRFMASQMSDARYATMTVEVEARENGERTGTFRASASQLVFEGHLKAYGADVNDRQADEDEDGVVAALPDLVQGDVLTRRNVDSRRHQTEPPPRYTEASLVRALEEEGIGRPSTYASIVQTVMKRDYVERQGRQLVPQELGFIVHDLLEQHMKSYVDVPFTGEMEKELDEVASGDRGYDAVLRQFWPEFKRKLDDADSEAEKQQETTDIRCNVCDQANLVIKWGRNGKFFACPRYPECTNSLPMGEDGNPVLVAAPKEFHGVVCPKDGGMLVQKSGPYGAYVDCVNREAGSCDFRAGLPVGIACPEEPEKGQLVEKQTKRGKFWGCWNYPNCSYTTNSIEPGKLAPARPLPEREEANKKLLERSARGKAAFAKRKANAATRARRAS